MARFELEHCVVCINIKTGQPHHRVTGRPPQAHGADWEACCQEPTTRGATCVASSWSTPDRCPTNALRRSRSVDTLVA